MHTPIYRESIEVRRARIPVHGDHNIKIALVGIPKSVLGGDEESIRGSDGCEGGSFIKLLKELPRVTPRALAPCLRQSLHAQGHAYKEHRRALCLNFCKLIARS